MLKENCQLEYDGVRGVLYVHDKDTGATILRIQGLPSDLKYSGDSLLDISIQSGKAWVHACYPVSPIGKSATREAKLVAGLENIAETYRPLIGVLELLCDEIERYATWQSLSETDIPHRVGIARVVLSRFGKGEQE